MYSTIDLATGLLLWLCAALSGTLFYLALAAHRVERDCGLRVTRARLLTSGAVALVVIALALMATVLRLGGPLLAPRPRAATTVSEPSQPPPADQAVAAVKTELKNLQRELADLDKKKRVLEKRRQEFDQKLRAAGEPPVSSPTGAGAAAESQAPALKVDLGRWAVYLVPALLLLGAVLLVVQGDPRNLIPQIGGKRLRTERRLRAVANLDELVEEVRKERYLEAILKARQLDERALERLDALDLLYFKSYCAIQLTFGGLLADKPLPLGLSYEDLLSQGMRDLESLLDEATNHTEGAYLLALLCSYRGEYERGLQLFDRVEAAAPIAGLPLLHNRSICLMSLAEQRLSEGDVAGADEHFRAVARLNVMADQIPASWVKVRVQNVRQSLRADNFQKAVDEIAALRAVEHLDESQRRTVTVICTAFEALIPLRQARDEEAARRLEAFLRESLPTELWKVSDEIADEHVESACDHLELSLPRDVYRALLYSLSAARARLQARSRRLPAAAELQAILQPLLCAFQFQLRERELLAALGGLYYWFYRDQRLRALEWMRSAVDMGSTSRVVRRILEQDRLLELEQRETLAWFRSKTSRFLRDPTLKRQVRQALSEELGRFQEYQPVLLDLDASADEEPSEPTISLLRERAKYLGELATHLRGSKRHGDLGRIDALHREYVLVVEALENDTAKLSLLEKDLVAEVGKAVLS